MDEIIWLLKLPPNDAKSPSHSLTRVSDGSQVLGSIALALPTLRYRLTRATPRWPATSAVTVKSMTVTY